jgi:hypothetical protein
MVTPELLQYVRNAFAQGATVDQLRVSLRASGWTEQDINFVLLPQQNSVNSSGTVPPPYGTSTPPNQTMAYMQNPQSPYGPPVAYTPQPMAQSSGDDTRTIVTILLLFFSYPIGLIVMWFWARWKSWVKILVSLPVIFIVLILILAVLAAALNPEKTKTTPKGATSNTETKAKAGASCFINSDCETGKCVSKGNGRVCTEGKIGDPCFLGMDCKSEHCVSDACTEGKEGDKCITSFDCESDLKCKSGTCQ